MEFSQKILNRHFIIPQVETEVGKRLEHFFEHHKKSLSVFYKVDDDTLFILGIKGQLSDPYHAIFDTLLELLDGRPVGSLNRLSSKELDNYLRDKPKQPALTFYNSEYLDLFSFSVALYKEITGIKESEMEPAEDFFERSFSEQIEYFEEILAKEFYPLPEWTDKEIDLVDCEDQKLFFSCDTELSPENIDFFFLKIKKYLPRLDSVHFDNESN